MINRGQSNELERIQKRCLRVIYGYEHDYKTLLEMSGLKTLEERRLINFTKFTNKTLKNEKYSHWFPKNPSKRVNRNTKIYLEEKSAGNRLYKSPIFTMRRHLNNTATADQVDLTGLFNLP